jgi:RNA polymerase sigma-70 factor (ECF subfamily)
LIPENNRAESGGSEFEIICGAKEGDASCFEFLYRHHQRYVYALCLRITRNRTDAEDLTQDVFLQVFRKVATFRGESSFSTWLHRVALNVVLKHLQRKKLPMVPDILDAETGNSSEWQFAAPDKSLLFLVDRVLLERCISQLPPGYRMTFMLHDIEGYEHEEIANMMRCSVGNSKSQLHKARLKLRAHLQPICRQTTPQRPQFESLEAA